MEPEFPRIDRDKSVSPHSREIEYALHLSCMINKVKEDPAQLRSAIYEFARARLKTDTSRADEGERQAAVRRARDGYPGGRKVLRRSRGEMIDCGRTFPVYRSNKEIVASRGHRARHRPSAPCHLRRKTLLYSGGITYIATEQPIVEIRTWSWRSTLAPILIGISLFCLVAGLAYNRQSLPLLFGDPRLCHLSSQNRQAGQAEASLQASARSLNSLPFPVPSDYGIYALNDAKH